MLSTSCLINEQTSHDRLKKTSLARVIAKNSYIPIHTDMLKNHHDVDLSTEPLNLVLALMGDILDNPITCIITDDDVYRAAETWSKICKSNVSDTAIRKLESSVIEFFWTTLHRINQLLVDHEITDHEELKWEIGLFDKPLANTIDASSDPEKYIDAIKINHPYIYECLQ